MASLSEETTGAPASVAVCHQQIKNKTEPPGLTHSSKDQVERIVIRCTKKLYRV
jgi:hypothetical protein